MATASSTVVLLVEDLASGEGRAALALAGRLESRGFRATLVGASGEPTSRSPCEVVHCPGLAKRWGWFLAARRLACPTALGSGQVLIHALQARMARVALELAERWRVPYLLTIEEFFPTGGVLRLGARRCGKLIAGGPEIAEELRRELGVPASLIAEIPFGVEMPSRPSRFRDLASVPVVGVSAPLTAGSGLTTFLHAARRVIEHRPAVEFVIAGEGPAESNLRRLAARLGISARLTLADDPSRGRSFWGVLDVYCQPSTIPSGGRNLATAMASGVPSIASDVPGLRAWLAEENPARSVPPGDAEALSAAILDVLADPWSATESGRRGRERVARLADPDREADALVDLYRKVIEEPVSSTSIRFDQGAAATSTRGEAGVVSSEASRRS